MTGPLIVPVVVCSWFMYRRTRSVTGTGTAAALLAYEVATGRMVGILSLPFAVLAASTYALERSVMFSRGFVLTVMSASVMTATMVAGSAAVAAVIYGRGLFIERLATALPVAVWWAVPAGCTVIVGLLVLIWHGGNDNAGTP